MISDSLLRRTVAGGLVLVVAIAVVFVGLRLYEGIRLQRQVAVLEVRIAALEQALRRHDGEDAARLNLMETFVFGHVAPTVNELAMAPKPRSAAEAWQVNRDKVLRERLRRLEEWRLSLLKDFE